MKPQKKSTWKPNTNTIAYQFGEFAEAYSHNSEKMVTALFALALKGTDPDGYSLINGDEGLRELASSMFKTIAKESNIRPQHITEMLIEQL